MMSIDEPMARYAAIHGKASRCWRRLLRRSSIGKDLSAAFSAEAGRDVFGRQRRRRGRSTPCAAGDMAKPVDLCAVLEDGTRLLRRRARFFVRVLRVLSDQLRRCDSVNSQNAPA